MSLLDVKFVFLAKGLFRATTCIVSVVPQRNQLTGVEGYFGESLLLSYSHILRCCVLGFILHALHFGELERL